MIKPAPLAALALVPLLGLPAMAQDWLEPLQNLVESVAPQEEAPKPKPVPPKPAERPQDETQPEDVPLPRERPEKEDVAPPEAEPAEVEIEEDAAVPVPEPRVYQAACPAVIMGLVEAEMAPPISEGECGERSPLTVTAVMSRGRMVPLSGPATLTCGMATALAGWLPLVDGYARTMLKSGVAQLDVGTSYFCRGRNNDESAPLSEHGFANGLDVVGVTLKDGRQVAVEADWMPASTVEGRMLRLMHDAACSSFMTTLGPEANAEHHDHLHLDLGCHGQSCQARICE